jgi:hypothetical protein
MEKLNTLLRTTLATKEADETCFIYTPKERIDPKIFKARYGESVVEDDGVTYSFNQSKINMCFKKKTTPVPTISWTLSITPFSDQTIHSVMTPSDPTHTTRDLIISTYVPEHAASSAGMMVVHFFGASEAEEFVNRLASM